MEEAGPQQALLKTIARIAKPIMPTMTNSKERSFAGGLLLPSVEEEQDAQDDKVQRSRPKALTRTDFDRPQHIRRLLSLHQVVAEAAQPLLSQAFEPIRKRSAREGPDETA